MGEPSSKKPRRDVFIMEPEFLNTLANLKTGVQEQFEIISKPIKNSPRSHSTCMSRDEFELHFDWLSQNLSRVFCIGNHLNSTIQAAVYDLARHLSNYSLFGLILADALPLEMYIALTHNKVRFPQCMIYLMKANYRTGNSEIYVHLDVVHKAVMMGDSEEVTRLLKNGVMYIAPSDHIINWAHCIIRITQLLYALGGTLDDALDPLMLANVMEHSVETRERMLIVFRGVEVVLQSRTRDASPPSKYAVCLREAFETIPEPIITVQEVRTFLETCLIGGPTTCSTINSVCEDYEFLFPESCGPLTPRSLQHLSRCQVRQNLREVSKFPDGVAHLEIPDTLKQYVVNLD